MEQSEKEIEDLRFGTQVVHAGVRPDPATGAIMTPIYQTSTYAQSDVGQHKGYDYSRSDNPTRSALQEAMAVLEGGRFALAFSSGMAAIEYVLSQSGIAMDQAGILKLLNGVRRHALHRNRMVQPSDMIEPQRASA